MAMIYELISHTQPLLAGLSVNFIISLVAMSSGTIIGYAVALARDTEHFGINRMGQFINNLCRNIPSFVLMFYMAFLIPVEIISPWQWSLSAPFITEQTTVIHVSSWIKGSLALTIPVIGFSGDLFYSYRLNKKNSKAFKKNEHFSHTLESWVNYFLIIIMASATASVIGVQEIVGVANNIIAAKPEAHYFRLWLYLYVAGWFLTLGIIINLFVNFLHRRVAKSAADLPSEQSG